MDRPLHTFFRFGALCAAVLLALAAPAHAGPVFVDNVMDPAAFAAQPLYASAGVGLASGQTSTVGADSSALQAASGRLVGETGYSFTAGYLYTAFQYDPSTQGAVSAIDFSMDRGARLTVNGIDAAGLTLTARPLIEQGGQVFMAISVPVAPLSLPALTPIDMPGLGEAAFGLFDFTSNTIDFSVHPDFGGGDMRFGFAMRLFVSGIGTADAVEMAAYADSYRLALQTQAVPEPGSLALCALALAAAAALARRRR